MLVHRAVGEHRLIDVAHTPAELRPTATAVVVDVLRATSTAVTALLRGYGSVICCGDLQTARALRRPGRELAGERRCRPIAGFDHGNSPRELPAGDGAELVLCTSNGSGAIAAAALVADEVLLAALVNLDAVVRALPSEGDLTVLCSGTDGRYALEDVYVAGRIIAGLAGTRTDAARGAECVAAAYAGPLEPLSRNANARVLIESGQAADIAFCARESVMAVLPRVVEAHGSVATVVDALRGPAADARRESLSTTRRGAP